MPFLPDSLPPLSLRLDSRLEAVADAGIAVRDYALAAGLTALEACDLELATVEAANNIIVHGYSQVPGRRFDIDVAVRDSEVQVVLTDEGRSIPAAALAAEPQWDATAEASRGLAIMRTCADRLEYRCEGRENQLLLVKRLTAL